MQLATDYQRPAISFADMRAFLAIGWGGRGIAVAPYLLFFDIYAPFVVSPHPGTRAPDFPLPRTDPGSRAQIEGFVGTMNHLIHPGLHLRFRVLQLSSMHSGPVPTHCQASFRYGAAGVPEQQGRLAFDFTRGHFEVIEGAVGIQRPEE